MAALEHNLTRAFSSVCRSAIAVSGCNASAVRDKDCLFCSFPMLGTKNVLLPAPLLPAELVSEYFNRRRFDLGTPL